MFFSNNVQSLGTGRVTSARRSGTEYILLVIIDGAVVLRSLNQKKQLTNDNVIGYCDECYFAGEKIIERRGNSLNYGTKN